MSNSMAINDFSSRFSHFVKEKRAFGIPSNLDALRGVGEGYNRSTMDLFPEKQAKESNGTIGRTIDLFPQISGFNSSGKKRASPEPQAAQMTIFYGGQVLMFDDLPADKANEVMNLARGFESSLKTRKVETQGSPVPVSLPMPNAKSTVNNPSSNQSHSSVMSAPNFGNRATMPGVAMPSADLPIARKASLHRFLEKRKDRLVAKAPASTNALGVAAKPLEGKAWLGLNSVPAFQQKQQQQHL